MAALVFFHRKRNIILLTSIDCEKFSDVTRQLSQQRRGVRIQRLHVNALYRGNRDGRRRRIGKTVPKTVGEPRVRRLCRVPAHLHAVVVVAKYCTRNQYVWLST